MDLAPVTPFCRRVEEGVRVVERMRELGLARGKDGLDIYHGLQHARSIAGGWLRVRAT
jgi:hypothetical protein